MSSCRFRFRVWAYSPDELDFEVWYDGLEEMSPSKRFVSEWAMESLENTDVFCALSLDRTKSYQVYGKAKLSGRFDYWGEYDEDLEFLEFESIEIPDEYMKLDFQQGELFNTHQEISV